MRKAIFNLFIVLIICITALGMPLNLELPDWSFDLPTGEDQLSYKSFIDSPLKNPSIMNFQIETENPENLSTELTASFLLDVMKDNEIISTLDASKLVKVSSTEDHKVNYTLNLSQENLNLSDGNYILKLYSNKDPLKDIEPLTVEVQYTTLSKYVPAIDILPSGMMNLTLYFSDADNEYLVPVTRFVKYNRTPLSTIIKNLKNGSNALGFASPIPDVVKLRVKKDTVQVYLPQNLGEYNTDQKLGKSAINSFIHSLTSVTGIHNVKFFVNGKESDNFFYGYSTRNIYPKNNQPKIYLGMDENKTRILLVPIYINASSEKPLIENIMDGLKNAQINNNQLQNLIAPIPQNVTLTDYIQNNGLLTLNFSKEFLYTYENRSDLQRMMVDAISYSFTSIEGIHQIQILVDGQTVNTFGEINLSQPINKPNFINPEE